MHFFFILMQRFYRSVWIDKKNWVNLCIGSMESTIDKQTFLRRNYNQREMCETRIGSKLALF